MAILTRATMAPWYVLCTNSLLLSHIKGIKIQISRRLPTKYDVLPPQSIANSYNTYYSRYRQIIIKKHPHSPTNSLFANVPPIWKTHKFGPIVLPAPLTVTGQLPMPPILRAPFNWAQLTRFFSLFWPTRPPPTGTVPSMHTMTPASPFNPPPHIIMSVFVSQNVHAFIYSVYL